MNLKAKELVSHFEGNRLKAYQDTAGIWTIGIGHTKGVYPCMEITEARSDEFFLEDMIDARKRMDSVLDLQALQLTDYEEAALLSQAFNLRSFPKLALHLQNSGKMVYKAKMLQYCFDVKGHKLNGLLIRRIAERLLFEGREWKSIATELQVKKSLEYTLQKQKELFV